MIKLTFILGLTLLLSGCGDWQMPSWAAGDNNHPPASLPPPPRPLALTETQAPAPPPRVPGFVMTTGIEGDPRWEASLRCGKEHRYSVLRRTEIIRTGKPDSDTINWYFECTY